MCKELKEVLNQKPFFNCVGGCGVDLSNGKSQCMSSNGVWFKHCPFVGRKLLVEKLKMVVGNGLKNNSQYLEMRK